MYVCEDIIHNQSLFLFIIMTAQNGSTINNNVLQPQDLPINTIPNDSNIPMPPVSRQQQQQHQHQQTATASGQGPPQAPTCTRQADNLPCFPKTLYKEGIERQWLLHSTRDDE